MSLWSESFTIVHDYRMAMETYQRHSLVCCLLRCDHYHITDCVCCAVELRLRVTHGRPCSHISLRSLPTCHVALGHTTVMACATVYLLG